MKLERMAISSRWMCLLALVMLMPAGAAQATPILVTDLDMSKGTGGNKALKVATHNKALSATTETSNTALSALRACEITDTCSPTMPVPEPQSLVMMGTGLLTMAGMIRRKLLSSMGRSTEAK